MRKFQNDFILKFRRFGQKFVFQINNYIIIIYLNLKGKLQKPISKNAKHFEIGSYIFKKDAIRSGASAYCRSKKYCECQVSTVDGFRKSGLATSVSAAFIENCYENNLEIPYDAANEISVKLGKSLGYGKIEPYSVYEIF